MLFMVSSLLRQIVRSLRADFSLNDSVVVFVFVVVVVVVVVFVIIVAFFVVVIIIVIKICFELRRGTTIYKDRVGGRRESPMGRSPDNQFFPRVGM